MRFDILTIFPRIFDSYLRESLLKRAREKRLVDINVWNIRDFASGGEDKRQTGQRRTFRQVDDRPFGGGPGMVMQVGPIYKAVKFAKSKARRAKHKRVILFSTRGRKFDSAVARRLSRYNQLILICGRYEGVDERVAKYVADEEISVGDYVLSGGELPALVLVETVSRFLPGFLGKHDSLEEIKGSYPVYTRPSVFCAGKSPKRGWAVPRVLLSGNHNAINKWRVSRRGKP